MQLDSARELSQGNLFVGAFFFLDEVCGRVTVGAQPANPNLAVFVIGSSCQQLKRAATHTSVIPSFIGALAATTLICFFFERSRRRNRAKFRS